MNDTSAGAIAPPAPPFAPVQIVDTLPPVPHPAVLESQQGAKTLDPDELQKMKQSFEEQFPEIVALWRAEGAQPANALAAATLRGNLTGLSRSEIRLLSYAVESHRDWRGQLVGYDDPDVEKALDRFDATVDAMRSAIKKLRKASGIKFSGAKKRTKR